MQNILLKPTGLYTFPNHLSAVPSGGLIQADNVFIDRDSIVESRRGFKIYGSAMGSSTTTYAHQLLSYKNRLIRHYGSGTGTTLEYDDGTGTFAPFSLAISGTTHTSTSVDGISSTAQLQVGMSVTGTGIPTSTTIAAIVSNVAITLSAAATASATVTLTYSWNISEVLTGRRLRSVESNGNLYFTSSEGMRKVSLSDTTWSASPVISKAGGIKAIDTKLTINTDSGFFSAQSVVGYRVLWGIKDANNNEILGTPSQREILQNISTDSATVDLRISIPTGVTTAHFYQVYRTAVLSNVNAFSITGDVANTSTIISNVSDTASLVVGMTITGTNISSDTTITAITGTDSIVISAAATGTLAGGTLEVSELLDQDPGDEQQLVYEDNPKQFSGTITGNTVAASTVVTSTAHGLSTGDVITISGSNSTPTINGSRVVTVLTANTFSIPVTVTILGSAGTWLFSDLTNGYISVTDIIPESFRTGGAYLYTNENSGEGILQANDIPPLCRDVTAFKDYTFYANTVTRHRLNLSLLSVSEFVSGTSTLNITDGTTTNTYTFKTTIQNGTLDQGSNRITGLSDTSLLTNGYSLTGTGIPDGSYITDIVDSTTIDISQDITVADSGVISANTVAVASVVTDNAHGLSTGDVITIASSDSTPVINGTYAVTRVDANSFSVPVTVTIAGTTGTWTRSNVPITFATESASSKQIAISQFATPAQQVNETARSLVHIINSQAGEIVYAYYLSGSSDVPGLILLEARALNQSAFYLGVNEASSTGIEFSPAIPVTGTVPPTNTVVSTNETAPNRIYYSKFQQPEAVPILNYLDVGPKDKAIVRILALRDSLFILKEDGVYRLSGSAAPFAVASFDFSTIIKAADSAVVLNNLIYAYSSGGVARISDTGAEIISRPIENKLIKLLIPSYTNFGTATFGVAYESDRSYYLFTVEDTSDTVATQCFRFNTFTNSWTKLLLEKRAGLVNPYDDKLYLAATDTNYLEQERKSFDRTDYADRETEMTLAANAVDGMTITLPSITNVTNGDILVQTQYLTLSQYNRLLSKLDRDSLLSPHTYVSTNTAVAGNDLSDVLDILIAHIRDDVGRQAVSGHTADADYTALIGDGAASFSDLQDNFNALITLLNADVGAGYKNYAESSDTVDFEFEISDVDTNYATITSPYTYPIIEGVVTVYNHILAEIQFVPQYLQDVSMTKQVSEGTLIFEDSSFSAATLSYSSDLSANFEDQDVSGSGNGIFGNTVFGNGLFGGDGSGVPFRTYIPREKQRCRYMNVKFKHAVGREIFSLYGFSLSYNLTSNKGWR